ncbi:MAG: hypothetical protein ACLPX5_13345 [Dissulfurispiraceae bacterium]
MKRERQNSTILRERRFYPDYLSEVIVAILICYEILIIIVLLYPPSLGRQIDLTKQFQPRPEWYFLWLFELVGYFPGKIAFVGTVIIPVLFVLLLILIPTIDKGAKGRLKASVVANFLLFMFIILTLINILK